MLLERVGETLVRSMCSILVAFVKIQQIDVQLSLWQHQQRRCSRHMATTQVVPNFSCCCLRAPPIGF